MLKLNKKGDIIRVLIHEATIWHSPLYYVFPFSSSYPAVRNKTDQTELNPTNPTNQIQSIKPIFNTGSGFEQCLPIQTIPPIQLIQPI